MNNIHLPVLIFAALFLWGKSVPCQDSFKPDFSAPPKIPGMSLSWNDEFNNEGKPDPAYWKYENGLVRNQELQWYQPGNANCSNGLLVITGARQQKKNPGYVKGSSDWRLSRENTEYTSASIQTRGLKDWKYGRFIIRARIDTSKGSWPAIWTLGVSGRWPSNGEIDIMEFYRINGVPTILANVAWAGKEPGKATWDNLKKPLSDFTAGDRDWTKKFHTWRMDWNTDSINLYLDDVLLNSTLVSQAVNSDGKNPFLQPHYILLNLAIGANGDDPSQTRFPIKFEVDYVRIYQEL